MLSELKLWISKQQLKRKIWKLRVKNPTWYGDIRYNEALSDVIKLMEKQP